MSLSKLSIRNAELVKEGLFGKEVFHVRDPHALIQAAGYLKYLHARDHKEGIYFRGQTKLYGGLIPNLFRGVKTKKHQEKRVAKLNQIIRSYRDHCPILQNIYEEAHEPLLQHYGLKTTWIDLVDNVWVALWFGCHRAQVSGDRSEHLHFERRISVNPKEDYAYILLIAADFQEINEAFPGYHSGDNTELVDLRMASPSVFLRPHSQHGLLFRRRGTLKGRSLDYSDRIRGVIRISLSDALSWLGEGKMLNTHSLFPPPYYDFGYQILLSSNVEVEKSFGSIFHIGA